jgi:tetratricopeptide (TPR) repeat protein
MIVITMIITCLLFSCASTQRKQSESKDADFYINRGIAYYKKGQYDQATSDYDKALEINPRSAGAFYNRGLVYGKIKGQYDQAISDFTKALEINPRDAEAYVNRGNTYYLRNQYDQAISDYDKALEINPRSAGAIYDRGLAHYFKKEYDKSWDDIKKAQDLGYQVPPKFLDDLRKASGREK